MESGNLADCIRPIPPPSSPLHLLFSVSSYFADINTVFAGRQACTLRAKWHQMQKSWCNASLQALAKKKEPERTQAPPRADSGKVLSPHFIFYTMHRGVTFHRLSQMLIFWGNVDGVEVAEIALYLFALCVCVCARCACVGCRSTSRVFDFEENVAGVI